MAETMTMSIDLLEGMRFETAGQDGVTVTLDSDAEHGGSGRGFRPMELLLTALGSCTAMDVVSILRKKRQHVTGYRIEVTGVRANDYPKVFTAITIRHILSGPDLSEDAARRAVELSEAKYCPAYAMLSKAAAITTELEVEAAIPPD
ncbi:MAG TPA: OsmC family protein [Chloroflexota bacterium]|nr:OsmC family protein [Chloroflexota bacterium]